ncbi:MAG TPA: strawberry notch family protein [Candidatus Limiplasma sp.]|nr:strawberry notch family protein [Candidatus Limiplasma sp.]
MSNNAKMKKTLKKLYEEKERKQSSSQGDSDLSQYVKMYDEGRTASGRSVNDVFSHVSGEKNKYGDFIEKSNSILRGNADSKSYSDTKAAYKDAYYARRYVNENAESIDKKSGAGSAEKMLGEIESRTSRLKSAQGKRVSSSIEEERAALKRLYDNKVMSNEAKRQVQEDKQSKPREVGSNLNFQENDNIPGQRLRSLQTAASPTDRLTQAAIEATSQKENPYGAITSDTPVLKADDGNGIPIFRNKQENYLPYVTKKADFRAKVDQFKNEHTDFAGDRDSDPDKDIMKSVLASEKAPGTYDTYSSGGPGRNATVADRMTQEERDTYYYVAQTQGLPEASAYFNGLKSETEDSLDKRQYNFQQENLTSFAEQHPVAATAASVVTSPAKIAGSLYGIAQGIRGKNINPYSEYFDANQYTNTPRSAVKQKIENDLGEGTFGNNVAQMLYDAGTSIGDMGASMVAGMGTMGGSLAGMGMSAASDTIQSVKMKGGTNEQALISGGVTLIAETATELLPVGEVLGAFADGGAKGLKGLITRTLSSALEEAPGEMASEAIESLSDTAIMGVMSDRSQSIQQYMAAGMSMQEAEAEANKNLVGNIVRAGLVGALSGTVSAAASYGLGSIVNQATSEKSALPQEGVQATQQAQPKAEQGEAETGVTPQNILNKAAQEAALQDAPATGEQPSVQSFDAQSKPKIVKTNNSVKFSSGNTQSVPVRGVEATTPMDEPLPSVTLDQTPETVSPSGQPAQAQQEPNTPELQNAETPANESEISHNSYGYTDETMASLEKTAKVLGDSGQASAFLKNYDHNTGLLPAEYALAYMDVYAKAKSTNATMAEIAEDTPLDGNALYSAYNFGKAENKTSQAAAYSDGKAATQEGAKSTGVIFKDPTQYTAAERAVQQEYLDSVDNKVLTLAKLYQQNRSESNHRVQIAPVSQHMAKDIQQALGSDFTGYTVWADRSSFTHIDKRHGKNGAADTSMANPNDIARMGYIVANYDGVERCVDQSGKPVYSKSHMGADGKPAPVLLLYKKIDGTYYISEAAADNSHHKLWIETAYLSKMGVTQTADDNPRRESTSETSAASPPETIIPQTSTERNTSSEPPTYPVFNAREEAHKRMLKEAKENGYRLVSKKSPSEELAGDLLEKYIVKGTTFNSSVLFDLADKAFGGTQAEGKYTPKDAYDALELAVNKFILDSLTITVPDTNGNAKSASSFVERLNKFLATLPTQTKRTEEQQKFQQFSTPPNIAYLAAWVANVKKSDTVLEPSAGIGGLAVFPKAWGATVDVNELSDRRLAVLKNMGFDRYFNENAEQLNNVLPDDVKPSLVLMNPPFSSTAGRTSTNTTHNAERHVEQALLRLSDGGRLVAILGKGMANDAPAFKEWWNRIRQKYSVRANISIDGSNYTKYGTTWGVQLAVIDKTGPQTGETVTGEYKDLTQIPTVLEGIRNDRGMVSAGTGAEQTAAIHTGEKGVIGSGRGTALSDTSSTASPSNVGGRKVPEGSSDAGRRGRNGVTVQNDGRAATSVRVSSEPQSEKAVPSSDGGDRGLQRGGNLVANEGVQDGSGNVAGNSGHGLSESVGELRPVREQQVNPVSDDGVYAEYVPSPLPFSGVKKHPANLVESAAMAAVKAPKATYIPDLPVELIKNGGLSGAQLENIVYAGQAHTQILPDGTRKGYFIGDGTGVGKGRQISGIILDNFRQGRTKAVWISKSAKLLPDAIRDWTDIGGMKDDVFSLNSIKLNNSIEAKKGILFAGYSTLRSEKNNISRLNQIINWFGKDYDGVIAFDEVHTMGNLLGKAGKRGSTDGSKVAQAGAELQAALPKARIVYVSATGATDVAELSFASRLGLWGEGTAFKSLTDFVEQISSSGLSAMELVARDMKSMGSYLARSISYSGVEYETLEHDMTPVQREIYDTMSEAWQITMQHMNEALNITNQKKNGMARSHARSAYFSSMQRFYSQILTSMAMPSVITDIKQQLADGKSCVLQIVNTNAAQQERELARAKQSKDTEDDGVLDELDLTPRGTLIEYLNKAFPVSVYEEVEDDNGKKRFVALKGKDGEPIIDKEAVRLRDELIEKINQMKVPDGPLEMLFDAFGADNVAEVTGRTRRVVSKANENGQMVRVEESRSEKSALADAQSFQDGKKRILIFSDAGGTGKSYHADLRTKNQQQRIHYLVQPGWSASKAVQGFGRTHRSNEASAPIYKLVTTDAMGQKRFVSTIARRLDQLGALTKGQRETGGGMFTAKDNLESPLARDSLYNFYASLRYEAGAKELLTSMGLEDKFYDEHGSFKMDDETARDMNTFLNRILALTVDKQNETFNRFYSIFENAYDTALKNGTLDMGMETVKAEKIEIIDDEAVHKDEKSGAETRYVQAKVSRKPAIIRDVSTLTKLRENFVGLYRTQEGAVRAVYQTADKTNSRGEISKMYKVQTPTFTKFGTWQQSTLEANAQEIPRSQWMNAWAQEVAKQPEYDESTMHMLTGTLLPVWNLLPHSGSTKAMRIIADNGAQYLGRVIPENEVDATLARLGAPGRTKIEYKAGDLYERILKKGETVRLYNDKVRLKRSRVNNEARIEITGDNLWYYRRTYPEIIFERIAYQDRYFIPANEAGQRIMERIMKNNPVESVESDNGVDSLMKAKADTMAGTTGGATEWNASRVGESRTVTGIDAILRKMRAQFNLPLSSGHIRGSGIRGQFDVHAVTVRTKITNDLPAAAHEIGHYLERTYKMLENLTNESRSELKANLRADMQARYADDPNQLVREGFAEYIRRYMQNRDTAQIDFPKTSLLFRSLLPEDALRSLDGIADDINAYYSLGADTAQPELMTRKESAADHAALKDKVVDVADRLYLDWVDANIGIRKFDRATGSNAYTYATNSAYADAVSGELLSGQLHDINGNYVSEGLRDALSTIRVGNKTEYAAFNEYLVVRHGPERLKEGMRIFANDAKNSTTWMNCRAQELEAEYPAFREASGKLYIFQRAFLNAWGVKTGLVSEEAAKDWGERWAYYVPLNRAMGTDASAIGTRRGYANQDSTIRKARGSGRSIIMPVDSIITNMVRMVSAAERNRVMQEIVNATEDVAGMGRFLEKVPAPLKRTTIDLKAIKHDLIENVLEANPEQQDTFLQLIQDFDDVAYQYEQGKAKGDVVTVLRNGEQEFYKVNDPLLLQSLMNMAPKHNKALIDAYGKITRFVTGNITGLNVVWSLFSNFPRDIGTYMVYSKDKNPVRLLGGIASAYLNMMKGRGADALYQEYKAMGGGKTSAYTADTNLQRNLIRDFSGDKTKWLNPLHWLEFVSNMIESGPRYATYRMMRTHYGMSPTQAFYESNDITVNFRRGGSMSRQATKFIPFFNAGIQGLDKFSRWISGEEYSGSARKRAATIRTAGLIATSLLIAALLHGINSKDDKEKKEYAQLSNYTKNSFFCFPLGDGKYFAVPKPRELAVLTSLMERAMEYYANGNENAFNDFYGYAAETSLPNVVSGLAQGDLFNAVSSLGVVGVLTSVAANKDFLGRPIESESMRNLLPSDRFNRRTSVAAKAIADVFGLSPLQVDYVGKNILGGFWKWNQALFPIGKENVDYTLGVANSYVKDNQYSTDIVNTLFDNAEAATLEKNSAKTPVSQMKYKMLYNMSTFYTNYNKLSKDEPESDRSRAYRQTVLDMLDGMNQYAKDGPYTPETKALEGFVKKNGGTEQYPTALTPTVKDKAGYAYDLTASQYVDYQTDYLKRYWAYVGDVLAAPETATENGLKSAKNQARSEAESAILGTLGAEGAETESLQTASSLGISSEEILKFNAAKTTASADGSFTKEEAISILENLRGSDAQKAYFYKEANGNATVASNPYSSVEELNRYIYASDPAKVKTSITNSYKDLIVSSYASGDDAAVSTYTNKLLSLDLLDEKGRPYFTQEKINGWINDYLKNSAS